MQPVPIVQANQEILSSPRAIVKVGKIKPFDLECE